jgi:hypothetical protein
MYVDAQGDLVLSTGHGEIHQHKPHVYQEVENGQKEITGRYVITEKHEVAFGLASYDAEKTLIIDPVLSYSTYLGGSEMDQGNHIRKGILELPSNTPFVTPIENLELGVINVNGALGVVDNHEAGARVN